MQRWGFSMRVLCKSFKGQVCEKRHCIYMKAWSPPLPSLYGPLPPPPPPFSTDRPHRNTENNLTCSAMGLSSQGFSSESSLRWRGIETNNWSLFVKFSYVDEYIRTIHHSEVITIIKPDVFIFCHSHRLIRHIVKCHSVAQYHPLVGLGLVIGTLTSKTTEILVFYRFLSYGQG